MLNGSTIGYLASYGTKGTADPTNWPGGRSFSAAWTDSSGAAYLFGGDGFTDDQYVADPGPLNDLWKYQNGEWTWIGGEKQMYPPIVYGELGVSNITNSPPGRQVASMTIDSNGVIWIYGGVNIATITNGNNLRFPSRVLSDLWKFENGIWTWMSGSQIEDNLGFYGPKEEFHSFNLPGCRYGASLISYNNYLLLFGGSCHSLGF